MARRGCGRNQAGAQGMAGENQTPSQPQLAPLGLLQGYRGGRERRSSSACFTRVTLQPKIFHFLTAKFRCPYFSSHHR